MSKPTGGPAFPAETRAEYSGIATKQTGMTLRDYFAAAAMQGFLASETEEGTPIRNIGSGAYEMADAMLKAREES